MEEFDDGEQQLNIEGISLIGQFNDKNEYILPLKIKQQFISVPKIITHIENNVIYCYFKSLSSIYNFIVEIDDKNKDDIVCAKLFLVEFYKNTNNENRSMISFLTKYTGYSAENFVERVKVVLKLYAKEDGDDKTFNEEILADKCKLQKKKIYRAYFNDIALNDKIMIQDIIKLLKNSGLVGENLLKELHQSMYSSILVVLILLLKKRKQDLDQKTLNELHLIYQTYLKMNKKIFRQAKNAEQTRMQCFENSPLFAPIIKNKKARISTEKTKRDNLNYSNYISNLDQNHNGIFDFLEFFKNSYDKSNDDNSLISDFFNGFTDGFLLADIVLHFVENAIDFGKELINVHK